MTPTEGAAAAAAYALLASALIYRAMSRRQLYDVLLSSAKATTSVGMLIAGALVFNYVVTIENIPAVGAAVRRPASTCRRSASCCWSTRSCWASAACSRARRSCWSSCRSSSPRAKALGIDPVHFGVVVVVNIMIGLLTPPFGLLLFIVANMTRQPLLAIVREAVPFIADGDRRARDHHLRAGDRALAAARCIGYKG